MIKQTWRMAMLIILLPNSYRTMALEQQPQHQHHYSTSEVKMQRNSDAANAANGLRNKAFRPHSIPK